MDGGGGFWRGRCTVGAQDKTIINQIMLRFRPIAPKPVTSGSVSGGFPPETKKVFTAKGRTKRKCVRVCKDNRYKRKKGTATEEVSDGLEKKVVTLQLLPEKTDQKYSLARGSPRNLDRAVTTKIVQMNQDDPPDWLNFKTSMRSNIDGFGEADLTVAVQQKRVMEWWVTVDTVTDTCMDIWGLGSTDAEKMKNLERDTCPGFTSDSQNRVNWVNEAYRRMVEQRQGDGDTLEITVRLVINAKLPYLYAVFTCQVKLQYTWGNKKFSQMVPCDVWRMACGGFAWRLDVKAALCLGR